MYVRHSFKVLLLLIGAHVVFNWLDWLSSDLLIIFTPIILGVIFGYTKKIGRLLDSLNLILYSGFFGIVSSIMYEILLRNIGKPYNLMEIIYSAIFIMPLFLIGCYVGVLIYNIQKLKSEMLKS